MTWVVHLQAQGPISYQDFNQLYGLAREDRTTFLIVTIVAVILMGGIVLVLLQWLNRSTVNALGSALNRIAGGHEMLRLEQAQTRLAIEEQTEKMVEGTRELRDTNTLLADSIYNTGQSVAALSKNIITLVEKVDILSLKIDDALIDDEDTKETLHAIKAAVDNLPRRFQEALAAERAAGQTPRDSSLRQADGG